MSTELFEPARRPALIPTPESAEGVETLVLDVTGGWWFHPAPGDLIRTGPSDGPGWTPIRVPGEPGMQGFQIEQDVEMGYRTSVLVPEDFDAGPVILRFEGVYSFSRVWVNGKFAGEHLGGFTRFEFDVTDHIRVGESNLIAVGVTDRSDSVSTASSYAGHPIGGILRPVFLVHVPEVHLTRFHVSTPVDDPEAGDARLVLDLEVPCSARSASVGLELRDPDGQLVDLGEGRQLELTPTGQGHVAVALSAVSLWSDEAPHLYELIVTVEGETLVTYRQNVGFRSIEVVGNELLVNGRSVLLRGVNRHDIHPELGRASDGTLERIDLELLQQANVNFVRTSHYPPHPALLEAADELGIYVEVENGVCWAGQFGWPATQDDPHHSPEYLGPLAEMVERDRNHPSVIIWSIGNESTWGENFRRSYDLVAAADPSRPVIMSFAGGPEDILSSHYPAYGDDLGSDSKPMLHDEVVHLPVYQSGDLRRDPGVHADWAGSIDDFMNRLRRADGGLGVAIWGGIDEQFHLPSRTSGFGPWGVVDVWRRRKPEWWALRRAYSPIRVEHDPERTVAGPVREITLHNDHVFADLSDFAVVWKDANGTESREALPSIAPRGTGTLVIPPNVDHADFRFETASGQIIDHHQLPGTPPAADRRIPLSSPPRWSHDADRIVIGGDDGPFTIIIDARTGEIIRGEAGGRTLLTGGPSLHAPGVDLETWEPTAVTIADAEHTVQVSIGGRSGPFDVQITIAVDAAGLLGIAYDAQAAPGAVDGRITEIGLVLALTADAAATTWESDSHDGIPSDGYLGRLRGQATRNSLPDPGQFGDERVSWNDVVTGSIDRSNVDGWSRDFRARRDGVLRQRVTGPDGAGIEFNADGAVGTRLFPSREILHPGDPGLELDGEWEYRVVDGGLNQGSVGLADHRCDQTGGAAVIRFHGSGIDCIGALGPDLGLVNITLDGELVAADVDLFSPVDCSGHAIYTVGGLPEAEHEVRIEVTGRGNRASRGAGVRLQSAEVFSAQPETHLAVLSRSNYPVSGSFDWFDPSVAETGVDGVEAHGTFTIRLLGPDR